MKGDTRYISVILPLKLEWEPCYRLPAEMNDVNSGDRVKVMFANKEYMAVVSETGIIPDTDPVKIKPILSIEEGLGRILPQEITLWRNVADYYLCSVGEVYKAAYPHVRINLEEARAAAKEKIASREEKIADSIRKRIARLEAKVEKRQNMLSKARKESAILTYSKELENAIADLQRAKEALADILDKTSKNGLQRTSDYRDVALSPAQALAYRKIWNGFEQEKPVMLKGVTGSGKTEIYIKLALECLNNGKNVLYLVPEIALSRQLEERLTEHFGDRLMTFHSGRTPAARRDTTESVREAAENGRPYILLGTRSSLFLPHSNLGLIVVDEEHDSSYKQDSPAPRYNGRDTALMMHKIHNCSIILGSATPSLEEMYNCQAGRHNLVELNERFHGAGEADIEIIDTKAERKKRGMTGNFSRKLIGHIKKTLARGEQVIILRSRRAWASAMQCENCGEILKCPHCNVSLSRHNDGRMVCHYCGYTARFTGKCAKCGGELSSLGAGTQRIEEEASALFPEARIARLDSDTSKNRNVDTRVIHDFSHGEIDILIGTQMVTKGFDFGNLGLVAVVGADSLLGMQDFRADEKAFQLLEQFRGRCGRREQKGLFVIQTSQPDHPVYRKIISNEGTEFNSHLLQERKDFNFPPYSRIIEICIKDRIEERVCRMAGKIGTIIRNSFSEGKIAIMNDPVTGPFSPAVDKVADQHIRCIRISLRKDRSLSGRKGTLKNMVREFEKVNHYEGHITINVDPS